MGWKYLIILNILISSNIYASQIEIKSEPSETEIFIAANANEKPMKLGKTPFKQDLDQLISTYVKENTFILTLKRKGYEPYNVLFTKTSSVDINLSVNLKVDERISKVKEHDKMMIELFNIQKLIRSRNITDALAKLSALEEKFGQFSIVSELKATAYYMNKDIENSLSYYRKAFALNPDNSDAYKMKVYLEKKLGVYSDI